MGPGRVLEQTILGHFEDEPLERRALVEDLTGPRVEQERPGQVDAEQAPVGAPVEQLQSRAQAGQLELVAEPELVGEGKPVQGARGARGLKARQRLVRVRAPTVRGHDRLDGDGQPVTGDQSFEVGPRATTVVRQGAARVQRDLLAAGALGDTQGHVNGSHHGFGVAPVPRYARHAD